MGFRDRLSELLDEKQLTGYKLHRATGIQESTKGNGHILRERLYSH